MALFSIGYEKRNIQDFISILHAREVNVLCDVRRNAISRKPGFSKTSLTNMLSTERITYHHLPTLGVTSSERKCLQTPEDYNTLFCIYRKNLASRSEEIDFIYSLYATHNVAIMCFERNPHYCHRHVLCDFITQCFNISCDHLN